MKQYIYLTKPKIVLGNLLSAIGGFSIASQGEIYCPIFISMVIGISLIIASGCIFNNIIDRDIDAIMDRTNSRALATVPTKISLKISIIYAITLGILGFLCLTFTKSTLAICLTIISLLIYIGAYSLWMKRKTIHSIKIGSISGSLPPVIGYCTITNQFDIGAWILLIMFSAWQIPHFYSIAIFRFDDYQKAKIPTFPMKKGIQNTKHHIIIYIFSFIITNILFTIMGYTSYIFLFIISIINIYWLYVGWFKYTHDAYTTILWAKKIFILSIVTIISLDLLLFIDPIYINYIKTV